jgi:hypothetical protein
MQVQVLTITQSTTKRNRSEYLLKRNTDLVKRFYFWFETKRTRIDDVYIILGREFYLSPRTVEDLISKNGEILDSLYRK